MPMPTAPETFHAKKRKRIAQQRRGTKQQRGYGGEWERISKMLRVQYPVCQMCHNAPSEDVDHIIPFVGVMDPRRTARSNLRAVCRPCHSKKTKGQQQGEGGKIIHT